METTNQAPWPVRDRFEAVIQGRKPDRIPFIGRLELWHKGRLHTRTLPDEFRDMPLTEIHRKVGFGRHKMFPVYGYRLRGVEVVAEREGEIVHREYEPVVDRFPDTDAFVPYDRPGVTATRFITAAGTLHIEHTLLEQMLATGGRCHTSKHAITGEQDYAVVEHILERTEFVPHFAELYATQAEFGRDGFVVPMIERIPFQQLLIDYFDTLDFFYALHDAPQAVERLMALLDERVTEVMRRLAELRSIFVEFGDNLDGEMSNPKLFRRYCLPAYQRYTDLLHAQGKKVGSHTDGNLERLLALLVESGLDVCESFSPAPLTPCTVEETLKLWQPKPIIWGGIPSPILEERTSEAEFETHMHRLLEAIGDRPIILNVVDMVLPNNSIERIRRISALIEAFEPQRVGLYSTR